MKVLNPVTLQPFDLTTLRPFTACLFDLDGVIVDTAKYHYLAWKQIADDLKIVFSPESNELLKGISRIQSLRIILELGSRKLSEAEEQEVAERKNGIYLDYIRQLTRQDLLPGVERFILELKEQGILIALGSASKNAGFILQQLQIGQLFDAVVDGALVSRAKPDPEVFLKGAEMLGVLPETCVVFEDAVSGLEAAGRAGMFGIGVGDPSVLSGVAKEVISGFQGFTVETLRQMLK